MKNPTIALSGIGHQFDGASAKSSAVTRNVDTSEFSGLIHNRKPRVGDIVLAKVMSVGDDKKTLQNPDGHDAELSAGDIILVAYGNRYAVQEYIALIPDNLKECHLVSGGGVIARIEEQNELMGKPTVIKPLGFVKNKADKVMNTIDFSMNALKVHDESKPTTIIVMGTGMDAGKTTSAAALVKGMQRAGKVVGFGKMTGTGLASDIRLPLDKGAIAVCDFVDMGYPSTYKVPTEELIAILHGLTTNLAMHGANVNIIEVADGVLQSDNKKLLKDKAFISAIDGILLAAPEALSALKANSVLHEHGIPVLALSGLAMTAPLTIKEFEQNVPKDERPQFGALNLDDLEKRGTAEKMLSFINEQKAILNQPKNEPEVVLDNT